VDGWVNRGRAELALRLILYLNPSQPQPTNQPTSQPTAQPQAVLDAGVTLISVGHRPTLVRYHKRVLQLGPSQGPDKGAGWELCSAEEFAAAAAATGR